MVGAGTRFLSGISYYTIRLSNALARSHEVSAILMRQLLPTRLYPGRNRVGKRLTRLEYAPEIQVFDGIDWSWHLSMMRGLIFLVRQRPDTVVFQWWSGTVLHSYVLLALVARWLGARVVIEFHEVLDTGEARLPLARAYVRLVGPPLLHMASGFVVHSEHDRAMLKRGYDLGERPIVLIPHGPYDHYGAAPVEGVYRAASASCCNLLFFGVIRPYKGVEDLIAAFDAIPEDEIDRYWLTVVGETWEGWTLPAELIAGSRYRHRITFINRYVHDEEVAALFAGADLVVLPYHRSSASGPLHIAMSHGLPVVVTAVGGLTEIAAAYEGATIVPPRDPVALRDALSECQNLRGKRFTDPHSWDRTVANYDALFARLVRDGNAAGRATEE